MTEEDGFKQADEHSRRHGWNDYARKEPHYRQRWRTYDILHGPETSDIKSTTEETSDDIDEDEFALFTNTHR